MKTSELLAETRAILDDHSSLVSGDKDELWSNERILRALNHVERVLCREGWVLIDDTTASTCDITLVQDQESYALHAAVLGVLSARLSDSDLTLARRTWDQLHPMPFPDPDFFDTNAAQTFDSGRPQVFATDGATGKIALWRKPDATAALLTLKLRVARLPLTALTLATDTSPEVKTEWHYELCGGAAGILLSRTVNNDTMNEGQGPSEAVKAGRAMYREFLDAARQARRDVKRAMLALPRFKFGRWAAS